LEADFEKGDFAAELLNEVERLFFGRDVKCDDDFVICHSEQQFVVSSEVACQAVALRKG